MGVNDYDAFFGSSAAASRLPSPRATSAGALAAIPSIAAILARSDRVPCIPAVAAAKGTHPPAVKQEHDDDLFVEVGPGV